MDTQIFKSGDKVRYKCQTYDFAYYSQTEGKCVLYEEGCQNMQDSFAVSIEDVEKLEPTCGTCGIDLTQREQ